MTVTLDITPDLEPLLEAEAARTGMAPADLAHDILRKSLARSGNRHAPKLSAEESRLLEAINNGPAAFDINRYFSLVQKRREETIAGSELAELRAFTESMERFAVERMENLVRLATLRGVDVEELMEELQIKPPNAF